MQVIAEWHTEKKDGDYIYEYDQEGKQVYKSFANEMAQIMNEMWESGAVNQGNNVSKDKRIMIRSVAYYMIVFYQVLLLCSIILWYYSTGHFHVSFYAHTHVGCAVTFMYYIRQLTYA